MHFASTRDRSFALLSRTNSNLVLFFIAFQTLVVALGLLLQSYKRGLLQFQETSQTGFCLLLPSLLTAVFSFVRKVFC